MCHIPCFPRAACQMGDATQSFTRQGGRGTETWRSGKARPVLAARRDRAPEVGCRGFNTNQLVAGVTGLNAVGQGSACVDEQGDFPGPKGRSATNLPPDRFLGSVGSKCGNRGPPRSPDPKGCFMPLYKPSFGWLTRTVRLWLAVTGVLVTLATIGLFAASNFRLWAWLAIAFLASWIVAFGWTARAEHQGRLLAESAATGASDPRDEIRGLLRAAVERFDGVANLDSTRVPSWAMEEYERQANYVYDLIDQYLGPKYATEFAAAGTWGQPNHPGFQEATRNQSVYLHDMIDNRLDSLPIMEDWDRQTPRNGTT